MTSTRSVLQAVLTGSLILMTACALYALCAKPVSVLNVGADRFRASKTPTVYFLKSPRLARAAESRQPLLVLANDIPLLECQSVNQLPLQSNASWCVKENSLYVNTPAYTEVTKSSTRFEIVSDRASRYRRIAKTSAVLALIAAMILLVNSLDDVRSSRQPRVGPVRLGTLDSLRGVAAVVVMCCHAQIFLPPPSDNPASANLHFVEKLFSTASPFSILTNGLFMVHVFWFLSGTVLTLSLFARRTRKNLLAAAAKRYFRLAPLCIVSSLAGFMVVSLTDGTLLSTYRQAQGISASTYADTELVHKPLAHVVKDAISLASTYNAPLWTIRLELLGSLVLFGVLALFPKQRWETVLWAVLAVACAFHDTLYFAADFFGGMVLASLIQQKETVMISLFGRRWISGGIIFLFLMMAAAGTGGLSAWIGIPRHLEHLLQTAASFGMVAAALYSPTMVKVLSWKPLLWVGERSFGLYVSHVVLQQSIGLYVGAALMTAGTSPGTAIVAATITSTLASLGASHWLTKAVDQPSIGFANEIGAWLVKPATLLLGHRPAKEQTQ
ncbi:acyltransferase [Verrucomicrobium sp. BvORR106]|uniref:acyltransferase family protein n=1 Tax=Verrucomicrobium sp. BvORR106 TaxID=1403819 RepID=UPI00056E8DB2|nr:acyltransferase [Verrucomicrobium sp. BvORR106]